LKTEEQIKEVRRLRRISWNTLLSHGPIVDEVAAALEAQARESPALVVPLSRWRLSMPTPMEALRRRQLTALAAREDHYDARLGMLVALTERLLEHSDDLADTAHLHTARYVWSDLIERRNRLIEANLGLVRLAVTSANPRHDMRDDLMHEGVLGLMRALRKFDPNRAIRFSTYAMYWIHTFVRRAKYHSGYTVRVPDYVFSMAKKVHQIEQACEADGSSLTSGLQRAGIRPHHVSRVQSTNPGSYDRLDPDAGAEHIDPAVVIDLRRNLHRMQRAMTHLGPRERWVLEHRFELAGRTWSTYESMGIELGLSREGVRQIQKRALARLRRDIEAPPEAPAV